ncbi:hypothetical protein ES708_24119 [subsurface metagenome]
MKKVKTDPKGVLTGSHYLDGDFAIAEGALAVGCRFFAGYPITPSTETAERFSERIPYVGGGFYTNGRRDSFNGSLNRSSVGRQENNDGYIWSRVFFNDGKFRIGCHDGSTSCTCKCPERRALYRITNFNRSAGYDASQMGITWRL